MNEQLWQLISSQAIPKPYFLTSLDQYYGVQKNSLIEKEPVPHHTFTSSIQSEQNKLRILVTTFWDYPVVGGLQNYITTLKAGLENLGHHVDVISPNLFPKHFVKQMSDKIYEEYKHFYLNRYGGFSREILNVNRKLAIFEMALRTMHLDQYDLFHAQDRFTANVLGRLNKEYQKPLLFTPHGFMTSRRQKFNLIERGSVEEAYYLAIDRKAVESSNHMIILCDEFRPLLKTLGAENNQMTTILTGMDLVIEKTKTQKEKVIITCISRLRPRKGHKYLLEAFSMIQNNTTPVELWIVGDGEMRDDLEKYVQTLQVDNVLFLGERKDISNILSQSDIFVLPTTSDTLPLSIIEAMFAEQAILTTNVGGIPEIIHDGRTGLLTEPSNTQQLAEQLSSLVNNSTLRTTLAQNAKTFAENHLTTSHMVQRIDEVYQSLVIKHDIPAVVLDLSATGIGIVRSLKEKGITVYAYDTKAKYEIGKTRYAICGICPNPVTNETDLVHFLIEGKKSFAVKPVLFAGSDDFVHFISKNRNLLSLHYHFLLPEQSLVEAVLDKRLTYELAVKHDIPCPQTFVIHDEHELENIIAKVTFPCILKPVYSSEFRKRIDHKLYKKAILVEEASQLREKYSFYRSFGELMIQEAIPGDEANIYSVKTFFDDQMNLIGIWMNQKIHQFPPDFGTTALTISIRDEEVIQAAESFLRNIQFKGLAITEFKRDHRDGKLKFIEINSRMGLTQRLSMACGVNLTYLYYLSLTGQNPAPITHQKEGIKWVYLVRDFLSFRQNRKNKKMSLIQWIKSLAGEKVEALFAWDDPLPFIRSCISHLKNLWLRR